jgi:hypothetical protein
VSQNDVYSLAFQGVGEDHFKKYVCMHVHAAEESTTTPLTRPPRQDVATFRVNRAWTWQYLQSEVSRLVYFFRMPGLDTKMCRGHLASFTLLRRD